MSRISAIAVKLQPRHYTLTVRGSIDFMQDYAAFAGEALAKTGAYLGELGLQPIEGPQVCFHNTDLAALDVEMGWTVAVPVSPKDGLLVVEVPPRRVVAAIDWGPYEQQDPTLLEMLEWIKQEGFAMRGPILYHYLNDTDRPPEEYLTQMIIPIQ